MTMTKLRSSAPWHTPISLPVWQEMWRIFSDSIPMPIVLDIPRSDGVRYTAERDDERRHMHALLVTGGYAVHAGGTVRLSAQAQAMLRVLARPHREVDLRMDIRGESVRALVAVHRGGNVVRATIHESSNARDSVVVLESVSTGAPEYAAAELLPGSPGTGRIRALNIPVADLERAVDGFSRSDRFIDSLTKHIGKAAGDVHDLLRRDHTLRAKFGVAALDPKGSRARHPSVLVVHDSAEGRQVLARRGGHLTIDRVDDREITRMLAQRLADAAEGRC